MNLYCYEMMPAGILVLVHLIKVTPPTNEIHYRI